MATYRTDYEQLEFIEARIKRLQKTLERLETLGLTSVSSGGNSKTFADMEQIKRELDRAEREYLIIHSRTEGKPVNPHFREAIVCSRKHY